MNKGRMSRQERNARLRALLSGNRCVTAASVFDPISARIAEALHFEIMMMPGSLASLSVLGAPDRTLLTLTEFAEQARRICRACDLPLMVDADHGYGNALNVMRTVEELEDAGVAALTIEDSLLPAAFGAPKAELVTIAEAVGKMRAAIEVRRDPSLVIIARIAALAVSGIDDTIARAKAYEAAGVDALRFTGIKTRDQLDAISDAVSLPILLGSNVDALQEHDYLASRRVRIQHYGHQAFSAAVQAVYQTMQAQQAGARAVDLSGLAPVSLMQNVTHEADYRRWAEDFLDDPT
jgi:carboxyvinyl-carboxyphosphonate phosphorylmutase